MAESEISLEARKEILKEVSTPDLRKCLLSAVNADFENDKISEVFDKLIEDKCSRYTAQVWKILRLSPTYNEEERNRKFQQIQSIVADGHVDEISKDLRKTIISGSANMDDIYKELNEYLKLHRRPSLDFEIRVVVQERLERRHMTLQQRFSNTCSLF